MEKILKFLENFTERFWWVVLLAFSIPAVFALFVPGYYGASDDLHIAWLHQLDKLIKIGQIPPRFVPDLSYGFGYPLFNFVFPLPFYIGEILHLIGLSFVDSIKGVFLISFIASVFGMYWLLNEFTNKLLSLAGALIYLYTPYRSTDTYIRGAIGESLSFVFLPLVTLAIIKLTEDDKFNLKWIGAGAVSLAFLVLSHNITSYMFFPALLLLIILRILFFVKSKLKDLLKVFLTIFLGFLISVYFWLPALMDSGLMKYDTVFNFADHFPTFLQLITPYWGYGASVAGPYDGMSFFLGLINILVLSAAIILLLILWKKYSVSEKIILILGLAIFLIALVMMNYRSSFIWQNLPLLPYFQFPWRFLILTTFSVPLFFIAFKKLKYGSILGLGFLVLTMVLNIPVFRPQDFLGRTDDYYLNKYIPTPVASEEYKLTQEEYLRLPVNTLIRPDSNYPLIESELLVLDINQINDLKTSFNVDSPLGGLINYNKYLFPGWTVKINGEEVKAFPGSPFGQINFNVPSGNHQVLVEFKETTFKLILDWVSLVTLIFSLSLIIIPKRIKLDIIK